MTNLSVTTDFHEMNELSSSLSKSDFFSSSKTTCGQLIIIKFFLRDQIS